MVNLPLIAQGFDYGGKALLVIALLLVHRKIRKEHKIDAIVLKELELEQELSLVGLLCLTISFIIDIIILT